MFSYSTEELKEKGAIHTASEIYQQPVVWKELIDSLSEQEESLRGFIHSIQEKHHSVRVIFTGAGTSSFIGDTLVPELQKKNQGKMQFESIPTTDIVSNPDAYLLKDIPTIMVSFARSGNSPESVASVSLGEQLIDYFYQVVITCNQDGQLAKNIRNDQNAVTVLMPDKAHDKSLAMTSSFTCMMIAAYVLFTSDAIGNHAAVQILTDARHLLDTVTEQVDDILTFNFDRIAYLGSGLLGQLSHEASLKMLELTSGRVVSTFESSLGFRHGPKSILDNSSAVVIFLSQREYTRKYDMDILRELAADDSGMKVIAVTDRKDADVEQLADWTVVVSDNQSSFNSDFYLAFLYIIFAQVMAMKKSIQLGITPDNPSPDGSINRVVKGVTIYDYKG